MKFNAEDLLQVFLDGSFTPEAQAEFDRLMRQDPLFAERVTRALAERLGPVPDSTVDAISANLDGKIGGLWEKNKPSPLSRSLRFCGRMALALAAVGGLYFGFKYWVGPLVHSSGATLAGSDARPVPSLKNHRSVSFSISAKGIKAVTPGTEKNPNSNPRGTGMAPTASSVHPQGQAAQALPAAPNGSASPQTPAALSATPSSPADLEGTSVQVDIENDKAQTVNVLVFDAQGLLVRHLFQGVMRAGEASLSWDGKDDSGKTLGSGDYTVDVRMGGESMSQTVVIQP